MDKRGDGGSWGEEGSRIRLYDIEGENKRKKQSWLIKKSGKQKESPFYDCEKSLRSLIG